MILSRKDRIVVGKKDLLEYFTSLSLWMLVKPNHMVTFPTVKKNEY